MNQDRLAAVVAAHERVINLYLLVAPSIVSATGQLTAADREAVIDLSPKLRTLGLPPYVIVHGRDPESVAVMTALRLRGAMSPTGNLAKPLPLPDRMLSHWELNENLERIRDGGEASGRVREIVLASRADMRGDGASILAISRFPQQLLLALGGLPDTIGEIKSLNVIRALVDQEGVAHTVANLGAL